MKLHVLHAADYGSLVPGSFIPGMTALGERLHGRGLRMSLVAPNIAGATWHDDVRSAHIALKIAANRLEAARLVRMSNAEIVHAHFFGYLPPVTAALVARPGRLFWHVHSTVPRRSTLAGRVRGWLRYRLLAQRAERIIAVSGAIADEAIFAGASPRKVSVLHNGIDTVWFRVPSDLERGAARSALGVGEADYALLFFGRDRYLKGADVLQEALKRAGIRVTLIVVDAGQETVTELASATRVIPIAATRDIRGVYWAADALVMPSRGEGFGFTLVEALATGLPAVVSRIPAFVELAADIANVSFAEPEDPDALARALRVRVAAGAGDASAAVGNVAAFDIQRWVDGVLALYGLS